MLPTFIRQGNEPLYPKILFNKPVTRKASGRLLLPAGHKGEFSIPTTFYQIAIATGLGECNVVLPDVLAKFLGGAPGTFFVPSTMSGSIDLAALDRLLELSEECDAIVLGASLSQNSRTTMLAERLLQETTRPVIIFDEAIVAMQHNIEIITDNLRTVIIATMAELIKLCGRLSVPVNIRAGAGLINKLEILQSLQAVTKCQYAVFSSEIIITNGQEPIVTPVNARLSLNPIIFYAVLSTFWVQNQANPAAGLATGAFIIRKIGEELEATDSNNLPMTFYAQAINRLIREYS